MGWAAEWGYANPFAFYFAGRGGMLGDVPADVVVSALGWFEPAAVRTMYAEGAGVAGAKEAAARMAEAHAKWGEKHFAGVTGIDDIVAVTEEMVAGLEGSAIPLFVGWRDAGRADSAGGRAAQLMQMLREWRGGLHLVATTAVGLSPLEAILSNEGEGQAKFFGWSAPFPQSETLKPRHDAAEEMTGRALYGRPGPGPRRREVRRLRGGRHEAARRHAVAPRPFDCRRCPGVARTPDRLV